MSGEQAVVCCHQERCQQQPSTRRARNLQRRRTPTSPKSPSMLTERHPCRSRIASAFPSLGTYMSEPQLGVIRLCHGWIGDDSRCRGRRTQITQCERPRTVWVSVCGASPLAVKLGKGSE